MPFPITLKSTVKIKLPSIDGNHIVAFQEVLFSELTGLGAKSVQIEKNGVFFRVGLLKPLWNWNLLAPLSGGRIATDLKESGLVVTYHLFFVYIFILATLAAVGLGLILYFDSTTIALHEKLLIVVFAWFWLICVNYVVTALRFPMFLRRCFKQIRKE